VDSSIRRESTRGVLLRNQGVVTVALDRVKDALHSDIKRLQHSSERCIIDQRDHYLLL
jgi:hypothetical protein